MQLRCLVGSLTHAINVVCSGAPDLTAEHVSHFISFPLPWQEHRSSTSHSCFSFKTLWRCPEPHQGKGHLQVCRYPICFCVSTEIRCAFWQMQTLQMVLGKVQMTDLIPALPYFNKSCSSLWCVYIYIFFFKCIPSPFFYP